MATQSIPQLPQAIGLTGGEQLEAVQFGTSVRVTSAQIASLSQSIPVFSVLTFGADPTGNTDSTAAINAADVAATDIGALLFFPAGTYSINQTGISRNGCSWRGAGQSVSVLKSASVTYSINATAMVSITSKNGWSVEDLGFDMSLATFSGTSNIYFFLRSITSSNWQIRRCAFTGIKAYSIAVGANGCSNWTIQGCYFNMPSPSTNHNQSINVSIASGASTNYQIIDNQCIGSGIFSDGSRGLFEGNIVTGWSFGSGITLGAFTANSDNVIVGNTCSYSIGGPDTNATYPSGIEAWGLKTICVGNACNYNSGSGIQGAGNGSILATNECYNNGQVSGSQGCGIAMASLSNGNTGSNCLITNNKLFDDQGSPTQFYGYNETVVTGSISRNQVGHNWTNGNKFGGYFFVGTSPLVDTFNGGISTNAESFIKGTSTNDSATTGFIGEFVQTIVVAASAVPLSTGSPANVTSINLTAGDWDVWGNIGFVPASSTNVSSVAGNVNTTSAAIGGISSGASIIQYGVSGLVPGANNFSLPCPEQRVSIATTTTVYLVAQASFTVSTLSAFGFIAARRRR